MKQKNKQTKKQTTKLSNYNNSLFETEIRITQKPVKLFHKCININVLHMSVFNIFMLNYPSDLRTLCKTSPAQG